MTIGGPHEIRNQLLGALDADDYQALTERATIVSLKYGKPLYVQDGSIDHVYFPVNCVISMLVGVSSNAKVEMATIGNEGLVGITAVLARRRSIGTELVQVPGDAIRIDADILSQVSSARPKVLRLMLRYLYALMSQIVYAGSCNRLHSMEERCARWLLQTHDRTGKDRFPLTQDLLAQMLAVRRATVNIALAVLKKAEFINYVRGYITVTDRLGLESAACPCYAVIRQEYGRLSMDE